MYGVSEDIYWRRRFYKENYNSRFTRCSCCARKELDWFWMHHSPINFALAVAAHWIPVSLDGRTFGHMILIFSGTKF